MTIAHPGDEEADLDQAEPLLRDADSYSLDSLDDGEDLGPTVPVNRKARIYVQHKIRPILPHIQTLPRRWFEARVTSWKRGVVLAIVLGHWIAYIVYLCIRASSLPVIEGYGEPRRLTCYSNAFVRSNPGDVSQSKLMLCK